MLEKLGLQQLLEATITSERVTRVMSLYKFALGIVLGFYVGFQRLNQLRFIARDPILTGVLGVDALPPQSTLWRFLAGLHLNVAGQVLKIQQAFRQRVWEAANVKLETVTLDTDTTVHTVYGKQMGARKSYNPKNKGKLDVLYRRPVSLVAAFPAISFDSHAGYDRHSWPQQMFRILTFLENDLHWESLHYLYIVACGILGRQQTVAGSARAGKIQNVAIVDAAVGVNGNFDGLAGPHVRQLCFFEISGDPDIWAIQRNDRHQLLARRDVLAWLDRSLSDDPADWRDNRCVLQVQLDLLKIRGGPLGFRHGCLSTGPLC